MEYILTIWLCIAGAEFDAPPAACLEVVSEHRSLIDCRAEKQAYRDHAMDMARIPDEPAVTFRIAPCVREGEA